MASAVATARPSNVLFVMFIPSSLGLLECPK
jgi:hypothetical protein